MVGLEAKTGLQVWTALRVAAALAFASQLLLLWVLPQEFATRPLTGSFVLLAAVCQGMLAARLLLGPARWAVRLGILLNATVVFVWIVTRFWRFPAAVGFAQLPVEPLGLAATVAEVALIVLLARIGRHARKERNEQAR
jgi:hypothetical protein